MRDGMVIRLPERTNGRFTGNYLEVTPVDALTHVVSQIARRPVPLAIQHYETAEMILVYADHMSAADADQLTQAFGPFPTLEALRTSIPEIEARMYGAGVLPLDRV